MVNFTTEQLRSLMDLKYNIRAHGLRTSTTGSRR